MFIINKPSVRRIVFLLPFLLFLTVFFPALYGQKSAKSSCEQEEMSISKWKVFPQAALGDSMKIFQADYNTADWTPAEVPGTVFTAYVAAGKEKDPNFGDNIYQVDKSKYDQNFWYRTEFKVPEDFGSKKIWLNFEGINNQGDIYLNHHFLGTLRGIVQRGKYDISKLVNKNKPNVLSVLVHLPEQPMANYASPTYIPSGGWDWMPYVPGLNMGITSRVFLSATGDLLLEDPWIRTELPSNAKAALSIQLGIKNATGQYQKGVLTGTIQPGNIEFRQEVAVDPGKTASLTLDKSRFSQLIINDPRLWWPNGYGDPNLYTCTLQLSTESMVSDSKKIAFGIRKYSYDTLGGVLHIAINGKKVFIKGGNWGMSEYLLRCHGSEYDTKVKLHQEMHFNMIRNWLGSTTDDEFYDACDKYGIMVWDDFWLNANPNLPKDLNVFNSNVIEKIKRERNHPSVAIWCGDNEGWPVAPLDGWIRENIKTFDGGDRYYQSNSHAGNLSGSGLWGNHDPKWYFTPYPESMGGDIGWGFRTETGTAVFPNFESFIKFMPKDKWWPRNEMWNKHFFGQKAFNATPDVYDKSITSRYGQPTGIEDYCRKAQLLNIETNKAMYEGWEDHMWEDASGIMTWMSQAAYPSMVWQTYDYYYDLTGAFWGAKSACEPLHIQWNPVTNAIKVINTTGKDADNLTAIIQVYNINGKEVDKFGSKVEVSSPGNSALECFTIPFYAAQTNVALSKKVVASSTKDGNAQDVTDGNPMSRWASENSDDEWIYVDLKQPKNINRVVLNWEDAYAKRFKLQVSDDAKNWKDVSISKGNVGLQSLYFDDVTARYVRMLGLERASGWGYSLWSFDVYGGNSKSEGLSDTHFVKLQLKDKSGKVVSDNFYWRGIKNGDFTALSNMAKVKLNISKQSSTRSGTDDIIHETITNPSSSKVVAFAIRVTAMNSATGEEILPAMPNDSYFSLLPGESRDISVRFKDDLLQNGSAKILAVPYNN